MGRNVLLISERVKNWVDCAEKRSRLGMKKKNVYFDRMFLVRRPTIKEEMKWRRK